MRTERQIRMEIAGVLKELWHDGYSVGVNDEMQKSKAKVTEAYDRGADEGYNKGYEDGKKGVAK